ncbi:MAG: T9SS type A sorting domain-containing protein [Chitinispirillaceae bacterium]|nr:T9SS type A sorting domain-containing protein [Chitinispirillaceae bacterium]
MHFFPVLFIILMLPLSLYPANISSTSEGGLWGDTNTWVGKVVPGNSDNVIINGTVSVESGKSCASLTISSGAILQNYPGLGWVVLTINGNIINNGVIRNNPSGKELWLECNGDIVNNGIWEAKRTFISTMKAQYISQGEGKEFRGDIISRKNNSGYSDTFPLIAGSNLVFNVNSFDGEGYVRGQGYIWTRLNMNGYNLTLRGKTSMYRILIQKANVFSCLDSSSVYDFTIDDVVTLGGRFSVAGGSMTFNGVVTVRDTLQNGGGLGWVTPVFNNKIINNGVIRNNPKGNELWIKSYGDIENFNSFDCARLYVVNTGKVIKLDGTINSSTTLDVESDKPPALVLAGSRLIFTKKLYISNGKTLEIPSYGELKLLAGSSGGTIINKGILRQTITPVSNGNQPLASGGLISLRLLDKGTTDTINVTTTVGKVYPAATSSARIWWRIESNKPINSYILTLNYSDSLLNGDDETKLDVYLTKDGGKNWTKISTPLNVTRDTKSNTIIVGTNQYPLTSGSGDIVLTSGGIVIPPSISTSIVGRSDIRVGPVNRYTISYWNNSSTAATGPFFIKLETGGGIFFNGAEINSFDNKKVKIPRDSLLFDTLDTELLFYVSNLEPNEARTFDIFLKADRSGIAKTKILPPFLAVAAVWVVTAIAEEYASNYMVNACYEMWRPYEQGTEFKTLVKEGLYHTYKKTNAEFDVKEAAAKKVAEKSVEMVEKSIGRTVASPLFLAKDILDCMKNMVEGMKDYVNGNFDKNQMSLRKVTSWDPNFKAGPQGYGDKGYLSTTAPFTYTIFFENKKEATAPAYTVIIRDTLDSSVFDISSVEFGQISHPRCNFKKDGNVLYWEFDSIELPPNVNPPEGEGFVQFTVHLKNGIPTGTEIKNRAEIVFDINPPILTNTALNVLDLTPPKTDSTKALFINSDTVEVSFVASDIGSGVKSSTVFGSYDNSPYVLVGNTTNRKLRVKVPSNSVCKFYVLSQDYAGNSEKESKLVEATPVSSSLKEIKLSLPYFKVKSSMEKKVVITFGILNDNNVNIRVYDLKGRCVKTIANNLFNAGRHILFWNTEKNARGTYYVMMKSDNFYALQKILLY